MKDENNNQSLHLEPMQEGTANYEIRVKGCLSEAFLACFEVTGSYDPQSGETLLLVATTDQAALYGLLNRLRDLGITLISVDRQPV
jgi:hypothetical protein